MKEYICAYCGKDTSGVDYDYLVGHSHYECVIKDFLPEDTIKMKETKKPVEIKNWDKLSGTKFDAMGAAFIIDNTKSAVLHDGANIYSAWIIPTNSSEPFVRVTLFSSDMDMQVKVLPPIEYDSNITPYDLTSTITKHHVSNPSIFVQTIAEALLSDTTTRDILSYISRKQDFSRRKKRNWIFAGIWS